MGMNKVSIIGFGRFGNLLYELLQKGFEVDVFDIDSNNDTSPIMTLIGLVIGMVIGFYHLVKKMTANKY